MADSYLTLKYNSKARWLSYWYQISEALEVSPERVLIVGKGSGITEYAIKLISTAKVSVITLDINNAVNSEVVGDVVNIPFRRDAFDVAICCQVLEHLPFRNFSIALTELHRIARKRIIISLPHQRKHIKMAFQMPFLEEKTLILKNPLTKRHCSSKQHCWEIGRGVSLKEVRRQIVDFFEIEKEFLNEINSTHRFFILKKK